MQRKTLTIGMLSLSAMALTAAHWIAPAPATAQVALKERDFQVVTARIQSGGDALYILNRDGQLAVFTYDPTSRGVKPMAVRNVADAFGPARQDPQRGGFVQARIARLAERVLGGERLHRGDAEYLSGVGGDDVYDLFYWANKIRIQYLGRDVKFCAIVAAKVGGCSEDCKFCAQSEHYDTPVKEQTQLTGEEVLQSAWHAAAVGADSFGIVNSGRGPTRSELEDWLKPLMMKIAREGKTRACATLGALTPETAKFLYDCGIRRINHNIETSERHYPNIVSTHPYSERINTLRIAKEAGLSLCSGGIFGMGEDWSDRLDMMFALREIGVDVFPINFLNAIHGTPLENQPKLAPMECLKIISICRFVMPEAELKVAGGREVCLRDLQSWIFFAGADSTMIGNYLTTYGRKPEIDHQMVMDLGLMWRSYDGGGVEPASENPQLNRVSHTGRHRIPILYEREFVAAAK